MSNVDALRDDLRPESLMDSLALWLHQHLINILVILLVAWIVRTFGTRIVHRLLMRTIRSDIYPTKLDRKRRVDTLSSISYATIAYLSYAFALISIVNEISPSFGKVLFASAGLFTVAIGFALKDLINDFLRGVFIITENQYRVGDTVEIGGTKGKVEAVSVRTTVLRDDDGNLHHVPNGSITVTTNKTMGYSRLNETIAVDASSDISAIEHVIHHISEELQADTELAKYIQEPVSIASIDGFDKGGMLVNLTAKITPNEKLKVRTQLYRRLHKALKKEQLTLAGISAISKPDKKPKAKS